MNAYNEVLKGVQWVLDNCTSYEVAKDLGISNRTINRYQNGTTPIDNMTAKTMGTIYNYYLKEMGNMITIEKKNNHKGIIGEEFKEVYSQYELSTAKQRINELTDEYERYINSIGHELIDLDDWEQEEYENARNVKKGDYSFDCGDYTYYITITKGVENIKKIIAGVENGEIELESLDPRYHEEEYIDAPNSIWIVHTVEGHEYLEVFFAEREEFAEVRQQIYDGEADESAFDELVYNEYADRFDYDNVVAYRIEGGEINWI